MRVDYSSLALLCFTSLMSSYRMRLTGTLYWASYPPSVKASVYKLIPGLETSFHHLVKQHWFDFKVVRNNSSSQPDEISWLVSPFNQHAGLEDGIAEFISIVPWNRKDLKEFKNGMLGRVIGIARTRD